MSNVLRWTRIKIMNKTNRRTFLKSSLIGGTLSLFGMTAYAKKPTPREVEGPFYPVMAQKDKDFDLTRIEGLQGIAKGKIINIHGRILDTDNKPVENATVDLWQANAEGRYRHPHDTNKAALDPDFQGWAIVLSGSEGTFHFRTIFPGSYPATDTWQRPPHIHFKISKKGYLELITQMYFPDHELNDSDLLLNRKDEEDRNLMIASKIQDNPDTYEYNIVLQNA